MKEKENTKILRFQYWKNVKVTFYQNIMVILDIIKFKLFL